MNILYIKPNNYYLCCWLQFRHQMSPKITFNRGFVRSELVIICH